LREVASQRYPSDDLILVTGGSQGSAFLNELAPEAAKLLPGTRWIHATGVANFEAVTKQHLPERYTAVPYLETEALSEAYQTASLAVGRSGGTLAEYALFRLPSVLVPLPSSADNHQLHNAEEFVSMNAATLLEQRDANPESLAAAVGLWLNQEEWICDSSTAEEEGHRARATEALAKWDVPDATERIAKLVLQ
jgi:UDP-N-acetylglucosamine--N-acetylmuramyl-(pentapeptide) pyrophosphoryl-undecaprenol N-acetylglucosamine transferase